MLLSFYYIDNFPIVIFPSEIFRCRYSSTVQVKTRNPSAGNCESKSRSRFLKSATSASGAKIKIDEFIVGHA